MSDNAYYVQCNQLRAENTLLKAQLAQAQAQISNIQKSLDIDGDNAEGWLSPNEAKALQAQCAALRQALDRIAARLETEAHIGTENDLEDTRQIAMDAADSTLAGKEFLDRLAQVEKDYNELIYAVARKFEGETRHQTALRYIQEAERRCDGTGQEGAKENPK